MSELPPPVHAYVQTHLLASRTPAYMLVHHDGRLLTWGGDCARYGLADVQADVPVEEQLPALLGLLPLEEAALQIPSVETAPGLFADLHLFPAEAGVWVLFLDATAEVEQRHRMQQKAHEMTLLEEDYRQLFQQQGAQEATQSFPRTVRGVMQSAAMLGQLLHAMDTVVMERLVDGTFQLLNAMPPWFLQAYMTVAEHPGGIRPADASPRLEHFCVEAEAFWQAQRSGQLRSAPWRETDAAGQVYDVEAVAFCLAQHHILCLTCPDVGRAAPQSVQHQASAEPLVSRSLSTAPLSGRRPQMSGEVFATLYSALDIAVFERISAGRFCLANPVPPWLHDFYPALAEGETERRLGEMFLFLGHFLVDAEHFWQANSAGRLHSGPWQEVTPLGREYHLEAIAVCLETAHILLLSFPKTKYEEKYELIQKARNNSLSYHRFHKELQQKDVLLHCIVHDLTGPLTSIMLGLSLLEADELPPSSQELIALCLTQAQRQHALIQEILDVFAFEAGASATRHSSSACVTDLRACCHTVMEAVQPSCVQNHLTLQFIPDLEPTASWQVVGETSKLERVLFNLLENATRYSPPASTITLSIEGQEDRVLTTVEDAGPGVSLEMVPTIFDKFSQGQSSTGKAGLGLYFCRIMVEGWGGSIGYTPRPTGGARFWFTLPRPVPQPALSPPVA